MASIASTVAAVAASGVPTGISTLMVNSPWLISGISSLPRYRPSDNEAARMPTAIGKSRPAPLLRISAGARLTVTRRSGKGRPVPAMAARTRAALSRTAASGSPTMSTRGSCELIRTSTSTATPSTPSRAAPTTRDMRPSAGPKG